MDEENVVDTSTMELLFGHETEGNPVICDNTMDLESIMLSKTGQT